MTLEARRWRIGGRVQGVGFRPFVFRLARSFDLTGWVRNDRGAVEIHAQGHTERLKEFAAELFKQPPATARARLIDVRSAALESADVFIILESAGGQAIHAALPPDLSTCDECLRELDDPKARRHRYPFINCTQCGPRYTIIRRLPYDRVNTTLDAFGLCAECSAEYRDPRDRRFHAQPLACAVCGPALRWEGVPGAAGPTVATADPLAAAVAALRAGHIIAVRGVGGYHLVCDPRSNASVELLRTRKGRPTQPFAVMIPWTGTDGLHTARRFAEFGRLEAAALTDPARPIVLVSRRPGAEMADAVAPGCRRIGLMLPYSPLHHLLLADFGGALLATSANISGEPVLTEPEEVSRRLRTVCDGFLHHDRPIARPAEDPVVQLMAGRVRPLRLGRGTAPLELRQSAMLPYPLLAVGAHAKGTLALAWEDRVVVSPHIGDYSTPRGRDLLEATARDLQLLYGVRAAGVVHDAHPQFTSTRWARASGLDCIPVWHHQAHAAAVYGEHSGADTLLCFTWDGVGLGPDQTLWGGEALLGSPGAWRRVASLRPFRLPGGERAARDPWVSALAVSWECGIDWTEGSRRGGNLLRAAIEGGFNAPVTTSVGRLFDAAAALMGLRLESSYEGEAGSDLQALCGVGAAGSIGTVRSIDSARSIPLELPLARDAQGIWRTDWAPLARHLLNQSDSRERRSARFHSSLAHALCAQALAVRGDCGVNRVGLTGGVFQNHVLTDAAVQLLREADFEVLLPENLPVNDAAISFGQIIEATATLAARH